MNKTNKLNLSLNGEWLFKQNDSQNFENASVPGCNYLDLLALGAIDDPFESTNEKKVAWVAQKDWIYCKNFEIHKEMLQYNSIHLTFGCIDTIADVYLNDNLIAKVENCHIAYDFDIKDFLIVGKNELKLYFYSPVNYVSQKQNSLPCPANANGQNGIAHIRKPQCHFGWDWGPVLTPSGIGGNVEIIFSDGNKIDDVFVSQIHNKDNVSMEIEVTNICISSVSCKVQVIDPNQNILEQVVVAQHNNKFSFNIENPQLWSIKELNGKEIQPLYDVVVSLVDGDNVQDCLVKKIGLRTITLNTSKDKYGSNFQFIINGTPIFAKGANWIPADSFITRVDKNTLEKYILSAQNSNFNMLRVWGGGYYESQDFYELCDKYGILVWQDFAFACQPFPFFVPEFRQNVQKEIEFNVKRLRNHASLALWCGNNEIELMSIAWKLRKDFVKWTEKYFYEILPTLVQQFDNVTPYIVGTPYGTKHNKEVNSDNVGDTHLWAVWHGLQDMKYYRRRMTRFCSEFGFESLPDMKCVEKFSPSKNYSLDSEEFNSHQKCMSGNKKMIYYIASRFRLPQDFEHYIYLSNICQQECIKDATEHWRRNKGRCNGSLFWQYNDCWPVCSWSSVDYYGNYKALQYTSKHFFAPIEINIQDEKKKISIFGINDTLNNVNCEAHCYVVDFDGNVIFQQNQNVNLLPNSVVEINQYNVNNILQGKDKKKCVFVANLMENGKIINHKTILFAKEKDIKLPQSKIDVQLEIKDNIATYTLQSNKFARLVNISNICSNAFSDNFFDLLPNQKVVMTQKLDQQYSKQQLEQSLKINHVGLVKPYSTKFYDFCQRTKIFMIPINFFSWIYYKFL